MPYYRLKVSLRVQGERLPPDVRHHLSPARLGFPGFRIGADLMRLMDMLDGSTVFLLADPAVDTAGAETAIHAHFQNMVGSAGPPNARWHLLSATTSWTIEDKIRWSPGYDAFASQLGVQDRTAAGEFDPAIAPVEFTDGYDFPDPGMGPARRRSVRLWVCFELEVL